MIIRPAVEQDRSALTALHVSADIESNKEAPEVMTSLRLSALSSRGKDVILVAEDDGDILGYFWAVAMRLFDYRIGILFYIYVEPHHRRRGIGHQLIEKGLQELHDLGVRRYWANPDLHSAPTLEILESLGFSQITGKVFYQKVEPGAHHEWGSA
jgi:GNAT superfamily N-acetyltransferase